MIATDMEISLDGRHLQIKGHGLSENLKKNILYKRLFSKDPLVKNPSG